MGIIGAFVAFFFDVGVSTGSVYGLPDSLANIDKIAIRHMILVTALASAVCGWIAVGTAHIAKAVARLKM